MNAGGVGSKHIQTIINLGIVAHVDAGKTSLTEQLLHVSGKIRNKGSVDKGTASTDSLQVEKERGISVRAAVETFEWRDVQINLIDTPGHIDFFAEVERVIRVLDCAVLVISAVDGVQANTFTLCEALKAMQVPIIIAINKIDRVGADIERVINECQEELDLQPICLQHMDKIGCEEAEVGCIELLELLEHSVNSLKTSGFNDGQASNEALDWRKSTEHLKLNLPWLNSRKIIESIAEHDDALMLDYLEGHHNVDQVSACYQQQVLNGTISPVLACSAKSSIGIKNLLDGIVAAYANIQTLSLKSKQFAQASSELIAVIFKIEHDNAIGKMAYVRVYKGQIAPRDNIYNSSQQHAEKVGQIKRSHQGKYIDITSIKTGDIGIVSGLGLAQVGDVLGVNPNEIELVPASLSTATALLTIQVKPQKEQQFSALVQALQLLAQEEPLLDLEWLTEQREIHIRICGLIQIEIIQAVLRQRFGLDVDFEKPSIIYQETPLKKGEGYERYWMPKPCWAIVKFAIQPGALGSGVVFKSEVGVNQIAAKYQNEIEECLSSSLKQGIKGWRVTDLEITLIDGSDHPVHSRSGDFAIATPMALLNGLTATDTRLLEPVLMIKVMAAEQYLGVITSAITKMRGQFDSPEFEGSRATINGLVPAATSMDFPVELASMTGGRAKLIMQFSHYQPCDIANGQTTEYRGVSPLDRDKWILKCRGALA
jgi:ribosomal protection tetracycline resistance protein